MANYIKLLVEQIHFVWNQFRFPSPGEYAVTDPSRQLEGAPFPAMREAGPGLRSARGKGRLPAANIRKTDTVMHEHIHGIYENGVFRPVGPLPGQIREHDHLTVTIASGGRTAAGATRAFLSRPARRCPCNLHLPNTLSGDTGRGHFSPAFP
jgi:hypothetical protein